MGQALSSETHSISGGDGYKYWVGLHMKVTYRGCKKTVYRGILLGNGPRWGERVVVKSFTGLPGTKDNWRHEVVKADATKQMVTMFRNKCRGQPPIRVVIPSLVQMDKVSKVNRWLEDRNGNRTICRDDWVSVEEYLPGQIKRYCPWNTTHNDPREVSQSHCLEAFSHFTFMQSQGTLVACDFQGTFCDDEASPSYVITDTIIHSAHKNYGPFDEGEDGINEYFKLHKCSSICRGWPVPTPLTPPPPFSSLTLTPPPACEDIVFPFPRGVEATGEMRRVASAKGTLRTRHATGDNNVVRDRENSRSVRESNSSGHLSLLSPDSTFLNEGHDRLGRERSHSSSMPQRRRFHSDRFHLNDDSAIAIPSAPPAEFIPSDPPAYEDCVGSYHYPT